MSGIGCWMPPGVHLGQRALALPWFVERDLHDGRLILPGRANLVAALTSPRNLTRRITVASYALPPDSPFHVRASRRICRHSLL